MKLLITYIFAFAVFSGKLYATSKNNSVTSVLPANSIHLFIHYPESLPGDTLMLFQSKNIPYDINYTGSNFKSTLAGRQKDGWFEFHLQTDLPAIYFMLARKKKDDKSGNYLSIDNVIIPDYLVEEKDDVQIEVTQKKMTKTRRLTYADFRFKFSGIGSEKYILRYQADSAAQACKDTSAVLPGKGIYNPENSVRAKTKAALNVLESNKAKVSKNAYDFMKADIIYGDRSTELQLLEDQIGRLKKRPDHADIAEAIKSYEANSGQINGIPETALLSSRKYIPYLLHRLSFKLSIQHTQVNSDSIYAAIKNSYRSVTRDQLITYFFLYYAYWLQDFSETLKDAIATVQSPGCRAELLKLKTRMAGQQAYDFNLPDTAGKRVRLSDYKGKVVFIDFWFTGCSACSDFYRNDLSKVEENLKDNPNVVFISICVDRGKDHWLKSVLSGDYTSGLAVNLFTDGQGTLNDVTKYYQVHQYPQPMIIGKDQKIYSFSNTTLRNALGLRDALLNVLGK